MGPTALLPLQRKARCRFLSNSAGFEPANLGPNGKLAIHYSTEDDFEHISDTITKYHIPMFLCRLLSYVLLKWVLYDDVTGSSRMESTLNMVNELRVPEY
jgi:hypothetical protein